MPSLICENNHYEDYVISKGFNNYHMRLIRILFLCLLLITNAAVFGQYKTLLDSINAYTLKSASALPDYEKYASNEKVKAEFEKIFRSENFFNFPYDSLKNVMSLTPTDKKFRLLSWGIQLENGNYDYFGYIILNPDYHKDGKKTIALFNKTEEIAVPESAILSPQKWYGAIYYDVIPSNYKGKKCYTLLGWKGNNKLTQSKIIEVLIFKANGSVSFGSSMFRKFKEKTLRVIFTYSSRASMSMRYEKQTLHIIKKVKGKGSAKKTIEKSKKQRMIVFDRLSAIDPRTSQYTANLEGQYQFYVPETNIFDAFIFQEGRWVFVKDVDARNPETKKQ